MKTEHAIAEPPHINWRGATWITAGALALYALFRVLPTGTNLHHLDFRVEGKGALEMCDPSRPQFIPVVAARSPVVMTLAPAPGTTDPHAITLTLGTIGGKTIGPADLLTVHTRKLHLLAVDESLSDYQHLHPEPGEQPGEWRFTHTPLHGGLYRIFADFTPAATARGLYSFSDYTAPGPAASGEDARGPVPGWIARRGAWEFIVTPAAGVLRAGQPTSLRFAVRGTEGGAPAPLELVMDAYAHLVVFDQARSGFAHLHPKPGAEADKDLKFDVMIPQPGRYVLWAQVQIAGAGVFAPFAFDVLP